MDYIFGKHCKSQQIKRCVEINYVNF
jgi:hypothetical protein